MFTLKLFDRKGNELKEGDYVKISNAAKRGGVFHYKKLLKQQIMNAEKMPLENETTPSCLGAVRRSNISKRFTPLQELITFMDYNRCGKGGKDFKGEAMSEAIRLLKREEEEIVRAFDKGNNQEFEDPEFWVNGEKYFNNKFKERFA